MVSHRGAFYLLLFGFLALSLGCLAQSATPQSQTVVMAPDDRSPVRVRYPAPDRLNDYQDDRDYQYADDPAPPDNPLAKLWDWIWRKISDFLRSDSYQNVWQYVILLIIAAFVIYLLRKAEVLGFLFSNKAQSENLDYETLSEDIHAINFDEVIEQAEGQGNFRLAVRLLYLKTLKQLADQGAITYKLNKTNRQYVYELSSSPQQAEFENITQQFEYVWYGDFPVREEGYQRIRNDFQKFTSKNNGTQPGRRYDNTNVTDSHR